MAKPSKPKKPSAPWRQAGCFLAWVSTVQPPSPRGYPGVTNVRARRTFDTSVNSCACASFAPGQRECEIAAPPRA
eukprot:2743503-Pyramimonas_sp.AAC.1